VAAKQSDGEVRGRKPRSLHPYAWDVLKGRQVVGELVRLACLRSWNDHRGEAAERGLYFDAERAEAILAFFPYLSHSKGEWAGQPFELSPWQEFITWELFGWHRSDGSRRFRAAYLEVAKKNGKTTYLAGLGLYLVSADGEEGAEVYTAATKKDQAGIMHEEAIRMVRRSPDLSRRLQTFRRNISSPLTASKYEPLGADSKTEDGLNVHGALIDELHAHPSGDLYSVIEQSMAARRSPLLVAITTAGTDQTSFCYARREYAVAVLEGLFEDDALFSYIAALDAGDDWRDADTWIKANPNLGVSVKPTFLAEQIEEATRSPRKESAVRRYRLNQWVRATTRWLSLDTWDRCAGDELPAELERRLAGRVAYAGLDLASTSDVAAFVLLFPPAELELGQEEEDDAAALWYVIPRFWIPDDDLEGRAIRTRVPYDVWEREGWLTATPGNVTDYRVIRSDIAELGERYEIRSIGFDRWNATETSSELLDEGFAMVEIAQNYPSMSPPMKELERLILSEVIRHGGHPVLRWMAANLEVKEHDGAIRPVKPSHKMSHQKVDGMVALIMALARALARDGATEKSVYEERGIRLL
jgi:phage terminase large subunit-like protein